MASTQPIPVTSSSEVSGLLLAGPALKKRLQPAQIVDPQDLAPLRTAVALARSPLSDDQEHLKWVPPYDHLECAQIREGEFWDWSSLKWNLLVGTIDTAIGSQAKLTALMSAQKYHDARLVMETSAGVGCCEEVYGL